jgi:NADP-dependent 3-hydroxy acid dehydrogenase YdfG
VTGASAGIGETLAQGLAGAGARVVLAARRRERLDALAERIAAAGGEALALACDVAHAEQVDALAAESRSRASAASTCS